jgi:hypothetical protein
MSDILKQITIPTPCHANWDSMTGDDRTRFCQECGKSVVNLSALTETEAASLVADQGDDLCAQVTRGKDGVVLTKRHFSGVGWFMITVAFVAVIISFFRTWSLMTSDRLVGRLKVISCPSDVDGDPSDDSDCDLEEEL